MLKAILIDVIPPSMTKQEADYRLNEAENLIKTFGGIVLVKKIQKKMVPNYNTYLGKGKIEQVLEENKELKANILIINNELKPRQTFNVSELIRKNNLQVWDRIDLILKIFAAHATTKEAKLEIQLASIKHMGPRIFGMGMELSQQAGGIGTRGVGETNVEFMKRHLKKLEDRIKKQLDDCRKVRKLHRDHRTRQNLKTVGIIGYTNAGKSSLLNALTKKGAYEADKLFATLDTRVGKMYLPATNFDPADLPAGATMPQPKEVLVSDTIGFIQNLPPTLINSFQSTLEETIESDLLLHVIDVNDPKMKQKIKVVNEILAQIEVLHKPTIYVFNKIDLNKKTNFNDIKEKYQNSTPHFVSARTGNGINKLKETISGKL